MTAHIPFEKPVIAQQLQHISNVSESDTFKQASIRKHIIHFYVLIFILSIGKCFGQFKYNPQAPVTFDPAFKIGKLDNGIRYMIRSNPADKGKAYFYAFFNIGAIQEEPNEYGVAHFIEHLYADFTIYDKWCQKYMNSIRLNFGPDIDAGTQEASTQYTIFHVPSQREQTLDSVMLILKEMPFHRFFYDIVEKHRKIIMEEWRLHSEVDDKITPIGRDGTKYTRPRTIGDTAIINHISANQLKYFHDKWYRPDHLTVIAIGDFDAKKMEERIKRIFSPIPKAEGKSPRMKYLISENKEPLIQQITNSGQNECSVEISYKHEMQPYTQKRLRTELKDRLIEKIFSQRLDQLIDKQNSLLSSASACYTSNYLSLPSYDSYYLNLHTRGNDVPKALNALLTEKERVEKYGFTNTELQQFKKEILSQYMPTQKNNNKLPYCEYFSKCYYYLLNGKISPSFNYLCQFVQEVIPTITLKDLNERFKEYTANIQPTINILIPNRKDIAPLKEQDIRTILISSESRALTPYIAPKPLTDIIDKDIHPGKVIKQTINKDLGTTEWTLSNGMRVVIKTTDFNKNEILFKGIRKDLLSKLKDEYSFWNIHGEEFYSDMGFGDYSNAVLNQFLKSKQVSVNKQFQDLNGYAAPKDVETCLKLIHLKYVNQQWNETAFNNRLQQIQEKTKDADYNKVLGDTLGAYIWQKSSIPNTITINQLKQIHQKVFGDPSAFTFIFSGNINTAEIKPLIERYLASIKPIQNPPSTTSDTILYKSEIKMQRIESNNREINIELKYPMPSGHGALIGMGWKSYYNNFNQSNNDIIAGLIWFRMQNILREKEHATYGILAVMIGSNEQNHSITFFFTYETDSKTVKRIDDIAKNELKQLLMNGPEEKEFESQKASITQNRLNNLRSNRWWIESALYKYYMKGKNIVPTYLSEIKDLKREDLIKLTKGLYSQGNLIDIIILPK